MKNYCGADCNNCVLKKDCKGCCETCGSPFGGKCIAAEYVKIGGIAEYHKFREQLKAEINALLAAEELPAADKLYEIAGSFINLEYTLPGGKKTKFLDDRNIYLGAHIESGIPGLCHGVVADTTFILITSYDDEPATVQLMHDFIRQEGYSPDISDMRFHHEIYLSDARRVAPEKLKTVIRHPIAKK